jgi:AmpD protein
MQNLIHRPLPHFDARPTDTRIDTLIVHSMTAEDEADAASAEACVRCLDAKKVSAHYLIDSAGTIWQCVAEEHRAWHAGVSKLPFPGDARENVNHFSIGIELINFMGEPFPLVEYQRLAELSAAILKRHPIRYILGHEHVAPVRKIDPGPHFDWSTYMRLLVEQGADLSKITFPPAAQGS